MGKDTKDRIAKVERQIDRYAEARASGDIIGEGVANREAGRAIAEAVMGCDLPEPDPEPSGRAIVWRGERYAEPSMAELESWAFGGVCETPDGRRVEPDHEDSWLRILGWI